MLNNQKSDLGKASFGKVAFKILLLQTRKATFQKILSTKQWVIWHYIS